MRRGGRLPHVPEVYSLKTLASLSSRVMKNPSETTRRITQGFPRFESVATAATAVLPL
jgi:hypothetical protein